MGSSESTPPPPDPNEREARQRTAHEAEKLQWQREQHWKEQQFREELKLKETEMEFKRQADMRTLKLQQEKLQKELNEQKMLRLLEKEKIENELLEEKKIRQLEKEELEKRLEEQRLDLERREEQRVLLHAVQMHQQQFQKVCTTTTANPSSSASSLIKETVALQLTASTGAKPKVKTVSKPNEIPTSYVDRMNKSNVQWAEWSNIDYIKDNNSISTKVAENLIKLFNKKNTLPFIARYRRHLTRGMDIAQLRNAWSSYEQVELIKKRAISIIKDVDEKGQWTPEFHALVHETRSLDDLEYVYSIFKVAKTKDCKRATELGLGIITEAYLKKKSLPLAELVQQSIKGLQTEQQIRNGIVNLMADIIVRDRRTFRTLKRLRSEQTITIETTKAKDADKFQQDPNEYELYYNFQQMETTLKPHQVFTINRGEALKILDVKINIPDEFQCEFKTQCLQQYGFTETMQTIEKSMISDAIDIVYKRWIKSSIKKRVRQEINEKAQNVAMDVLAQNVKKHLLAPPVRNKVVIGINPGFENGCKIAVVSQRGDVLETGTIFPNNANNPKGKSEAERKLVKIICKHKCTVIALGSGIASIETEGFLVHAMKNKKIDSDVVYTIVDESGASIYSSSREAAMEFPGVPADIIFAVSIARRLQDPLAELIKIDPELLTAEIYQQDLPKTQMAAKMNDILIEVVNLVGVDINTVSVCLLKRVAGLDEEKANNIVEWRRSSGPFTDRSNLLKVKGISKKVFEQCAGFIRIVPETAMAFGKQGVQQDSFELLDQTWIHPESYNIAISFLEAAKCDIHQLGTSSFIFTLNRYIQTGSGVLHGFAGIFGTHVETIEMIAKDLMIEMGQDIRGKPDISMFRKSFIRFADLNNGDLLTGVVTALTDFGAFVDVGAEIDGLIHKKSMNGQSVEVGQKVKVRVSNILKERGRLGLTLIEYCID